MSESTALLDPNRTRAQSEEERFLSEERSGHVILVPGYVIHEMLGEGGMGVVYKATQLKLNRTVALKMIVGGQAASSRELLRFLAEVEAVAQIDHPHVVRIYESGDTHGRPYFAMEHLSGGSLADRIKASPGRQPRESSSGTRTPGADAPGSPRGIAELFRKLALAVQAAHDCQIVHRDLKPANVLFDAAGEPRITDFGLAKKGDGGFTATNAIMGTPAYMAPEQAKGESKFVGPAADVWALGVMLYECLTGAKPFAGSNEIEILRKVVDEEPSSLRSRVVQLPKDLELIVQKCLTKDPAARYRSAGALAEDLRRWLAGEPISVVAATRLERSVKWVRRNRIAAGIVAASILCVVMASVLAGLAIHQREEARRFAARADEETEKLQAQSDEQGYLIDVLRIKDALSGYDDQLIDFSQHALLEVHPDNRTVAWHFARRRCFGSEIVLHAEQGFTAVKWSPDGNRITTTGIDGTVAGWNLVTGQREPQPQGPAPTGDGRSNLNPNGKYATATAGNRMQILDAATGATLREIDAGEDRTLPPLAAWSPDGRWLATRGDDGAIVLHGADGGARIKLVVACVATRAIAWSPDSRKLCCACDDGSLHILSAGDSSTARILHRGPDPVRAVHWTANSRLLAHTPPDTSRAWDSKTDYTPQPADPGDAGLLKERTASPNGAMLATIEANTVVLVESSTSRKLQTLAGHDQNITSLAWSPDGKLLATGGTDRSIRVWDAASGECLRVLQGKTGTVQSLAWTPDGRTIAAGRSNGIIRLWDVRTGQAVFELDGHVGAVHSVAFCPVGYSLLSAGEDGTVRVWESQHDAVYPEMVGEPGPAGDGYWYLPRGHERYLKLLRSMPPEEQARRRRILGTRPEWHRDQEVKAEAAKDDFAAAFHRQRSK